MRCASSAKRSSKKKHTTNTQKKDTFNVFPPMCSSCEYDLVAQREMAGTEGEKETDTGTDTVTKIDTDRIRHRQTVFYIEMFMCVLHRDVYVRYTDVYVRYTERGGGLGSSTIFKKFNETYAPS